MTRWTLLTGLRRLGAYGLLLVGTTSLYATHLMGGEIELICVNSGTNPPTYRIRVRIYRDCRGISQPSTITVRYQSSSCNVNQTITLNRTSITDFTPLCPGQQSVCQNSGSPNIGWEEHVYESSSIQLQACTDWVISTTDCCRNSSITTGSNDEDFYIYIQVNTQAAPCNNSPRYSNRPAALLCNNQSFCFNPGVSDPDGDNLVFRLTNCRTTGVNTTITYNNTCNGTCSGSNPLPTSSGTSINSTNGTVCLQPNATAVGPICLLIEEYRGGTKIGEYLRDMQIQVQNCAGNPPQASAINGTLFAQPYNPNNPGTYTYVACVNQNFCFTINFRDPDNQNVTVLPPTGLPPGATWNVTNNGTPNATGQLCWTPTTAGTYNFTVTVEDNSCPVKRQNTYGYTILVEPPTAPRPISFNYQCGATTVIVNFDRPVRCNTIAANGSDFQFTAPAGAPGITGATGIGCSAPGATATTQIQLTLSGPLTPGTTYTLRIRTGSDGNTLCGICTGAGSCLPNPSDFNIPVPPSSGGVSISPTNPTICRGQTVTLTANANLTVTNYEWYANGGCAGAPFASGAGVNQVVVSPTTTTTYCVRATFGGGCGDATATTTVTVRRAPTACFNPTSNPPFCAGQSVTFNPSCSEYVKSCGGLCLVACDNPCGVFPPIPCNAAACAHTSIWLLPVPPFLVLNGPGPSSLNPITITFPAQGEYTVQFTLCEPFGNCCHTVSRSYTVNCVLSSADVSLSAQRQGRDVRLTWAVNVADSLQRFQIMRATRMSRTFEPIATLEGHSYSYVDRDLAPNSYLYRVVQELPSGGRLESEAVEVVVHPVSESEFYVHGGSAPLGEAMLVSWIRSAAEPLTLTLYDQAGRQLYTHHTSSIEGSHLIPSPNATGIYLLEVVGGDLHRTYRLLWY
jgi:hypothetical protein